MALLRLVLVALCLSAFPGAGIAVERSIAGATITFPGSETQVYLARGEPGSPDGWIEKSRTGAGRRVQCLGELAVPRWIRWAIALAPEAVMERISDNLVDGTAFQAAGGVDFKEPVWVVVNGHPGWRLSMTRRDMSQIIRAPSGTPALLFSHKYVDMVVLWSGESLVAAVSAGDDALKDEPFLTSLRTATTVVPGDPEAQWDHLCQLWCGGAVGAIGADCDRGHAGRVHPAAGAKRDRIGLQRVRSPGFCRLRW